MSAPSGALLVVLAALALAPTRAAAVQDVIFADGADGFDHTTCDSGQPVSSDQGTDFAAALDLCKTATEQGTDWAAAGILRVPAWRRHGYVKRGSERLAGSQRRSDPGRAELPCSLSA